MGLDTVMGHARGASTVPVGLIDGPVDLRHPALADATLHPVGRDGIGACVDPESVACGHGTFTAGILAADRSSGAPGICPDSPLLIRPIFSEAGDGATDWPHATPTEVTAAIGECIAAGARIVNLSVELVAAGTDRDEAKLTATVDRAAQRGVLLVTAAGNHALLSGDALSRHPWVIPVAACNRRGDPLPGTNLGASIGRRGVMAPGEAIVSLSPGGTTTSRSGTSAAAAFVSGALALAWSLVPRASGDAVRYALTRAHRTGRRSIVPPLLSTALLAQELRAVTGARSV
ncbi:MAG: S8 family serine peptidase [Solirubrobacteraceae bacterium]